MGAAWRGSSGWGVSHQAAVRLWTRAAVTVRLHGEGAPSKFTHMHSPPCGALRRAVHNTASKQAGEQEGSGEQEREREVRRGRGKKGRGLQERAPGPPHSTGRKEAASPAPTQGRGSTGCEEQEPGSWRLRRTQPS